jgi:ribosomal protein S18 acetylase RimI-like enzyme
MFTDAALAARIDRADARSAADLAAGVRARHPDDRTLVRPFAGGLAVYTSPRSPLNKVIGLGFDGPIDLGELAEIEREWHARREPLRIELSILADASIPPALTERGYRLHGFENILGRALHDDEPAVETPGLTVERLHETDAQTWLDIAVTAFMDLDGTGSVADDSMPRDELERVLAELGEMPGFLRYVARIDGEAAGVASLRLDDDLAQVAGAGTLPAFRGRGIQKALLRRRLADARAAGCHLAVVTTAPGTRSQANVMRRGFELLYTRIILLKPHPGA